MSSYTISEHPQGTPGWLADRVGCFTASNAADMLAVTKSGPSARAEQLRTRLALERVLSRSLASDYTSAAMDVGTEREPLARAAYEAASSYVVAEVGFFRSTVYPWMGGSPDGLIDGGRRIVEFKCRQPLAHWEGL